ncbi:Thermonuclease precursor [Microbacterium terrae]|uniref:Thermonuclease n=1 Tax=Microbacterium terrae TaxID=69369 RepID=A0A0M2HF33_9MICO|nr:thermonuclease family protein [Microbacterium terrae]KJL45253.1 Thermonuclease precursor [Microbacterium terrae]
MKRALTTVAIVGVAAVLIGVAIWLFTATATVGDTADSPPGARPAAATSTVPDDAFAMTVESVHDGDTLRAHVDTPNDVVNDTSSTRVRLLGVDTPEIAPTVECWGDEATAQLSDLAPAGSTIWAAADVDPLDRYGRHLLYLWTAEGEFINAALIEGGSARVEVYSPNTEHEALLRSLEAEAVDAGVGRWGACG